MGIFRKASTETKRLFIGDSKEDWVEVLSDLSKRQFNAIVSSIPGKIGDDVTSMSVQQATQFQHDLFVALVTGWSLDEEPTEDAYLDLSADAANAIDAALADHFSNLNPGAAESKSPSTSRAKAPTATA